MNNSINATIDKTLIELLYDVFFKLFSSLRLLLSFEVSAVTDYLERIQNSIAIARDRHAKAKTRQIMYVNKKRRKKSKYKIEDAMYLNSEHIRLVIKQKKRSAKFFPRFIEPFNIIRARLETSTYKLYLLRQYKFHLTFHVNRLKSAILNDFELFSDREQKHSRLSSIELDDNIYIVDNIKNHRHVSRGRKFLIH